MGPIWYVAAVLFLIAIAIFAYVAWKYRRKRINMEFVTYPERQTLQSLLLVGITLLLMSLIGIGTVVLG